MKTKVKNQLPGIYFTTEPPAPSPVLPRMDIAAFVGIASSGPLNTPVPIEDMDRFRDIFGDNFPIAWNPATGRIQYALLAPSVEAFFSNGGQRCWVVRVAKGAKANRFSLPGLVRADNWQPALSFARSEGSWSDSLRVGTVKQIQALNLIDFQYEADDNYYSVQVAAPSTKLSPGDLLQLNFGDNGPLLFLVIDYVEIMTANNYLPKGPPNISLKGSQGYWFLRSYEPADISESIEVFLLNPEGEKPLPILSMLMPKTNSDFYEVELDMSYENAPLPGELLRINFAEWESLLLPLTKETESLPGEGVRVGGKNGLWPVGLYQGLKAVESWQAEDVHERKPYAEIITFDIIIWNKGEITSSFTNLGFSNKSNRFWARLPSDKELFELPEMMNKYEEPDSLKAEASEPRFPLTGHEDPAVLYLPIGMHFTPRFEISQGPLDYSEMDSLTKNGIESFNAGLFLDTDLADIGSELLLREANHKYYLQGRPLSGIHCLLPINEITLITTPDAVQLDWERGEPILPDLLLPPVLNPVASYEEPGTLILSWSSANDPATYRLQESTDPAFSNPEIIYEGKETTITIPCHKGCPLIYYYRINALYEGKMSPWSNTQKALNPQLDFENCQSPSLEVPQLNPLSLDPAHDYYYIISWSSVNGATRYILQESADPLFSGSLTIFTGSEIYFRVKRRITNDVFYYRVRAENEERISPWSNTCFYVSSAAQMFSVNDPEEYSNENLLSVQRALLRFCAARGDMFTLLSLPYHYTRDEIICHLKALMSIQNGNIVDRDLSFGAVYHPWVEARVSLDKSITAIQPLPPEGSVCGTIALRAITRGPWIAPANEPLRRVVSLISKINLQESRPYIDIPLNLIRQDIRGFLLLSACTLCPESAFRSINVRRLLILLRRLALLEGSIYVFQPNDSDFHTIVKNRFEHLLARLYNLGAFAGNTPAEAYKVVTDQSINTSESLQQGRFIVELRVAPSHPLAFITLRLIQTGHEKLTMHEA
ncbi:MAG: hypothetical protein ACMUIU_01465 [bacterium]